MSTGALLVLDAVRDMDRVLRVLTVDGSSGEGHQIVEALRDDVYLVERDAEYHPSSPKDDRLFVQMLCNYWYPGSCTIAPETGGQYQTSARDCGTPSRPLLCTTCRNAISLTS